MQQTIASVVFPVEHDQVETLKGKIEAEGARLAGPNDDWAGLRERLPGLHFLSIVVFDGRAGVAPDALSETPQLILEVNFDGLPGPFWSALQTAVPDELRNLLRHCSPPLGASDTLFLAVTRPDSRAPIAPLLERQCIFPSASHAGNRGLSQRRVQDHKALYEAAEAALPPPPEVQAQGANAIHQWLRAALLPQFRWLDLPYQDPITVADEQTDLWALLGFAAISALVAFLPWWVIGLAIRPANAAALALLVGAGCTLLLKDIGAIATLAGKPEAPDAWMVIALVLLVGELIPLDLVRHGPLAWVVLFLVAVITGLLILLALLRHREREDTTPAESVPDPVAVRALQAWEDCHLAGADHMASLVTIKPGQFRGFLIRFGMRALTLAVRTTATDGYLGSMRTIHFAHWAIIDHGRRLVFFSNFDGSWESYLDDFIEKAHAGLTLAWGNCTGFPPARYLTLDGASQGRKFKAWARCSMAPSTLWYAAYPNLTVNQIFRQAEIAKGLCARSLSADAAAAWAKDL